MGSRLYISCISETLDGGQLRAAAQGPPERETSLGESIAPSSDADTRKRIARFSSLTWSVEFEVDGTDELDRLIGLASISWSEAAHLVKSGDLSWTVVVLLDSQSEEDQIRLDGLGLRLVTELSAELSVKVI